MASPHPCPPSSGARSRTPSAFCRIALEGSAARRPPTRVVDDDRGFGRFGRAVRLRRSPSVVSGGVGRGTRFVAVDVDAAWRHVHFQARQPDLANLQAGAEQAQESRFTREGANADERRQTGTICRDESRRRRRRCAAWETPTPGAPGSRPSRRTAGPAPPPGGAQGAGQRQGQREEQTPRIAAEAINPSGQAARRAHRGIMVRIPRGRPVFSGPLRAALQSSDAGIITALFWPFGLKFHANGADSHQPDRPRRYSDATNYTAGVRSRAGGQV